LRDDGLKERILSSGVALALELGDPEGSVSARCVRLVDVGHEGSGITTVIPVDADEVDLAACALGKEVSEPGEPHGSSTVGDGWRAKLRLASEGHHVGFVTSSCCCGRKVGLGAEIGLVHAHQVGGASGNGLGCCSAPAGGEGRGEAP
jgi:hypothetical protein